MVWTTKEGNSMDKKETKFSRKCLSCENYPMKCLKGSITPNHCADYKPRNPEQPKENKINWRIYK